MNDISQKVCKACGTCNRSNSGQCKTCSAKYRENNREKARIEASLWRVRNPEKAIISAKISKAKSAERNRAYAAEWFLKNKDRKNATDLAWRLANPERRKAIAVAYFAANPTIRRAATQIRRARKKNSGGRLSPGIIKRLLVSQKGLCPCCNKRLGSDYHLDHIMPLALGGSNTDANVQLLRASCNQQKHAKHPIDFMQSRGFLL